MIRKIVCKSFFILCLSISLFLPSSRIIFLPKEEIQSDTYTHTKNTLPGIPIYFIPRSDGKAFQTQTNKLHILLSDAGATIRVEDQQINMRFLDGNLPIPFGQDPTKAKAHLFIGDAAHSWVEDMPLYKQIIYCEVYQGIDLIYTVKNGNLKYEFIVHPGADPNKIAVNYHGHSLLSISPDKQTINIKLSNGEVLQESAPYAYQLINGQRQEVKINYVIVNNTTYRFKLNEEYDPTRPLVIDPELLYITSIGGSQKDEGFAIAADSFGNTFITGITQSPDFPITPPDNAAYNNDKDVFVIKLDKNGTLLYSTIIGGSSGEEGNSIAVDGKGNAYIVGETFSPDFPVLNAWQTNFAGYEDAYLLKLDPEGHLAYSTFIGGTGAEEANDIVVDTIGNAYIAGEVYSDDYPLLNPWSSSTFGFGEEDGFISIFNAHGELVYSTYISAQQRDQIFRITIDKEGYIYATGMTSSPQFPTMEPLQSSYGGGWDDCFIFKFDPQKNQMVYSTFLGGVDRDECWGIVVDQEGSAYVTGFTRSHNFPIVNAIQPMHGGEADAFLAKINPDGKTLAYSTFIGGHGVDQGWDITIDSGENIYISGETGSTNFPHVNALQPQYGGGEMDGFLIALNPMGELTYSSFLGGMQRDRAWRLTADKNWVIHVTGATESSQIKSISSTPNGSLGGSDAFVAQFELIPTPTPTPTPTPFATQDIGAEGGILWLSYPGHITLLSVPKDTVKENTNFKIVYNNQPNNQNQLQGLNHFFSLSFTHLNGQIAPLNSPIELTLGYNETQGVMIDTINLYYLQDHTWITNNITITNISPGSIIADINRPGIYGLMGRTNRFYLPTIQKFR